MAKSKKGMSDHWTEEAKRLGYPARSVFKLMEIDKKFKLFEKCEKILDVGSAPGSWTMYISEKVLRNNGMVVSCDLNPLSINTKDTNIVEITGDAFSHESDIKKYSPYDVVVSDAAPHTTGNRTIDCAKSYEISSNVYELSKEILKKDGNLVFKIYQGSDTDSLVKDVKKDFAKVAVFKPEASRNTSFECFVIALKKLN